MTTLFPNLFQPTDLGIPLLNAQFERCDSTPDTVANVNIVPFIGELCVIILTHDGVDIPGGTLEPGETVVEAARRELLEEAGAHLLSFHVFGAWKCHSAAEKPFRPHIPHPDFYRLVGYGEVELVSPPLNPEDGEQVIHVETLPVSEASARFRAINRPDLAELYELAAQLR